MVKIVEQSEYRLRLFYRSSSWLIILLWFLALGWTFSFLNSIVVHCQRQNDGTVHCRVENRIFGLIISSDIVHQVLQANLKMHSGRSETDLHVSVNVNSGKTSLFVDDRSYVQLRTKKDPIRIADRHISSSKKKQALAESINKFLGNAQQTRATFVLSPGLLAWIVGSFLIFIAIGSIFTRLKTVIDSENDTVHLKRRMFFQKSFHYRFSDVERFIIAERQSTNRTDDDDGTDISGSDGRLFTLGIRLKNGLEIPLTQDWTSWGLSKLQRQLRVLESFRKQQVSRLAQSSQQNAGGWKANEKICKICQQSCKGEKRFKDTLGNYYHEHCYQKG